MVGLRFLVPSIGAKTVRGTVLEGCLVFLGILGLKY